MPDYSKENTGVIGKNTRKTQDTHADISGSANIEGQDYFVDGWLKERNDGSGKFYSLKFKPKQQRQEPAGQPDTRGGASYDDDLPFAAEFR